MNLSCTMHAGLLFTGVELIGEGWRLRERTLSRWQKSSGTSPLWIGGNKANTGGCLASL